MSYEDLEKAMEDKNNPNYKKYYSNGAGFVTTKLNLIELHYYFLRNFSKEAADFMYDNLSTYTLEASNEDFKKASAFKFNNKNSNISYVDAIGYIMAERLNIKFLTGDKQFKDLDNVEFVK